MIVRQLRQQSTSSIVAPKPLTKNVCAVSLSCVVVSERTATAAGGAPCIIMVDMVWQQSGLIKLGLPCE